jgi:hypothetical protein
MTRLHLSLIVFAIAGALPGCGGAPADDGAKARLATELVGCKNEQSNLKEQLAELRAQLAKAQSDALVKLEPVDVKAGANGVKHMEGNVSPDAVVKVVRQNSSGLRACYEHALKRKPDLQYVSSVTARFSVRNSGSAQDVTFAPHTDQEMERCMASTMTHWKFPSFQGDPVAFEQPVNLVAR